ncbi:glycosyltransferase [Chryseolinea sp. H1M3-3]|uniref:glycosyltransferase family 4 protein n=1 Tax=Chryseolinea sp. H1M3-3 TaxID=3034144 RepID=UPI0023ECBB86|nr:glycosyltransferase [Chryseolinea sp. H1M3-3]
MVGPKRILFLSGVDFKEKSIQVIRKTPEAYVQRNWEVHYIVGRDNSVNGDYFYESVINPEGVIVHRFIVPLTRIHGLLNNVIWKAVWFRIRNIILVCKLAYIAAGLIRKKDFHVIYGYEIPGVLAVRLLRFFRIKTNARFVTRFQGVLYVKEWLRKKQRFRFLSNIDAILALKTKADLCIMTNDGSQGLDVLKKVKSPVKNILFFPNGVDKVCLDQHILDEIRSKYYPDPQKKYLLSISRLDNHKRIDRSIRVIHKMVNSFGFTNFRFIVIGGGVEYQNLIRLIDRLHLKDYFEFLGPIKHEYIKYHFALANLFLSMYTSTNVGNPLLEAIRHNKVIITLNNGDTGDWIAHRVSGFIYDVNDDRDLDSKDYEIIARDVIGVLNDPHLHNDLTAGVKTVEASKLWTWDERFQAEVNRVELLLS